MRDDEVEVDASSGLISILGGKWTTHRAMAESTINAVEKYLKSTVTPGSTPDHPLSGAEGYDTNYPEKLASEFHIPADTARHLAEKFGTVRRQDPGPDGEQPTPPAARRAGVPGHHSGDSVQHSIRDGSLDRRRPRVPHWFTTVRFGSMR